MAEVLDKISAETRGGVDLGYFSAGAVSVAFCIRDLVTSKLLTGIVT